MFRFLKQIPLALVATRAIDLILFLPFIRKTDAVIVLFNFGKIKQSKFINKAYL